MLFKSNREKSAHKNECDVPVEQKRVRPLGGMHGL